MLIVCLFRPLNSRLMDLLSPSFSPDPREGGRVHGRLIPGPARDEQEPSVALGHHYAMFCPPPLKDGKKGGGFFFLT